jgi:hypothetical protein
MSRRKIKKTRAKPRPRARANRGGEGNLLAKRKSNNWNPPKKDELTLDTRPRDAVKTEP